LRARLFGQPARAQAAVHTIGAFSRWLVPAFGCFLLVAGGISQRSPDARRVTDIDFLAQSGGNDRIMLAEARQHSEINAVPVKHMQYSFGSNLSQPVHSAPAGHTNHLIQQ
jgi:hypothetical protein